jgi:RNA polymerase sigma-70 factor (ECF subfamily)
MAGEPTDVELVREVLAGRVERFEVLVHRYQRLVATAALRMGIPREEVEDVTSEVFFKVYRSLHRYQPQHALSTWLYRITVNAALDRRRSRRRQAKQEEIPASLADGRPSAHAVTEAAQRTGLLRQALERVPDHYRAPLILVHVEGMPLEEAARALDLPEGTVKSRLFRGRSLLKEIIRRHYPALVPAGGPGDAS